MNQPHPVPTPQGALGTLRLLASRSRLLAPLIICVLALGQVSCRKPSQTDATKPLEQSFQGAEPEIKQAIETVNANLRSGNYAEATKALAPVVSDRPLTEPQKQAVGIALQRINRAVGANPALDTKEMYELRLKLYRAVDSGKRF